MSSVVRTMELSRQLREQRIKQRNSLCLYCNLQIFCAYILSLLSSLLISGGFYLAIIRWDHMWLILSITGFVLIFIGACIYYCGHLTLDSDLREKQLYRRRNRDKNRRNDHLMSSNSSLRDSRSLSQLSVNMIPQYFSSNDTAMVTTSQSMAYSQIFRVNGQSFLILPLPGGEAVANTGDTTVSLQNLLVKKPDLEIFNESKFVQAGQNLKKLDERLKTNESTFVEVEVKRLRESTSTEHLLPVQTEPQASTSKPISNQNESRSSFLALNNTSELRLSNDLNSNVTFDALPKQKILNAKDSFSVEEQQQYQTKFEANFISNPSCSTDVLNNNSNESTANVENELTSLIITVTPPISIQESSTEEIVRENLNEDSNVENNFFNFRDETAIPNETSFGPNGATPPPSYDEVLSIEIQKNGKQKNLFETL